HLAGVGFLLQRERHVTGDLDDRFGLFDARAQHLLLHQIARESAGDAEAQKSYAEQDAELGSNRQIVQLHGTISSRDWRVARAFRKMLSCSASPLSAGAIQGSAAVMVMADVGAAGTRRAING